MSEDDGLDPLRIMRKARHTLSAAEVQRKYRKLDHWGPNKWYSKQLDHFSKGAKVHQRIVLGANQSGKSLCCSFETALHATGLYGSWWTGRRFKGPVKIWVVGPSLGLVRDGAQEKLLGMAAVGELGTGMLPLDCIAGRPIMIQGGGGHVDTIAVWHHNENGERDGQSTITFKSFEQGAEKLQAISVDAIWIDERCSEDIFSELLARTTATDGIVYLSYTPLKGGGPLTERFLREPNPDRAVTTIDIADALHIKPDRADLLADQYREHERDARLHGIPQQGIGRVFPVVLSNLIRPFDPDTDVKSWSKWIVGCGFGYDHPFAALLCAWCDQTKEFWVIDSFQVRQQQPAQHVSRIASMCKFRKVPIGYPHDGNATEKGSGQTTAHFYRQAGAPMLGSHAINSDGSIHTEVGIMEMIDIMERGTFFIAPHNTELIEQLGSWHRDEKERIVKTNDDLAQALRIAWMCRNRGKTLDAIDSYPSQPGLRTYDFRPRPQPRQQTMAKGLDDWSVFGD